MQKAANSWKHAQCGSFQISNRFFSLKTFVSFGYLFPCLWGLSFSRLWNRVWIYFVQCARLIVDDLGAVQQLICEGQGLKKHV